MAHPRGRAWLAGLRLTYSRTGGESPWTPDILARGGPAAWAAANLLTLVLYVTLGGLVSEFFAAYGLFPAPIWLPTGVAMVAAMVGGARLFPGIFLGSFVANALLFAPPVHVTVIISLTNAAGPVFGAWALRRFRPEAGLFTNFPGVVAFVLCTTLLSPALSATGGTLAMALGQPLDFAQLHSRWVSWWLTDSGGTLYLAPALILWLGMETECESRARQRHAVLGRHNLAVWGWIALISVVLFLTPPFQGTTIRWAFPFLLVVPLSWIALRMSLRSAYSLITLVAIVSTAGTVAGVGPFQNQGLANPLQLVGTLVVLLAMNVLTIVALVSELNESQSAIRVKSMFLANTSHELRTPLNAIIGFSSMMETEALGPMGNNAYRDYARLIHTSGEHLLAVINGLLDMSKIEAGHFELKEEKFRLGSVVEEAMELIGVQARRKGIVLSGTNTESDLTIFADPNAMRQIMLNLLSNAVKFTPDQGRIAVETARGAHAEVVIRVADSGIGIPDEALERVFQPFERLQKGKDFKAEGTGLGLSITRGLVQLHGGTVALARGKDGGTIATVTLPASRAAGAGATAGTWRETLPAAPAAVR